MIWSKSLQLGEFPSTLRMVETLSPEDTSSDFTLVDENTIELHPWTKSYGIRSGELSKTLATIEEVLKEAASRGMARDSTFTGAGGGVICDMTAFAASLYMRGTRVKLIPTTLLAMVDAAIGGKTGVDFMGWKNLVGTFYPAVEVILWPKALKTLPPAEFISGLAEVIKHAMLRSPELWDFLEREKAAILARDPATLEYMIKTAAEVKLWYVENDLREAGVRAHLNLGHTFGHALESATGFTAWKHGEAVAWGMMKALKLGEKLGVTDSEWTLKVQTLLLNYGYKLDAPGVDPEILLSAMSQDKKKKSGEVRFILQKTQGETLMTPVPNELVLQVL